MSGPAAATSFVTPPGIPAYLVIPPTLGASAGLTFPALFFQPTYGAFAQSAAAPFSFQASEIAVSPTSKVHHEFAAFPKGERVPISQRDIAEKAACFCTVCSLPFLRKRGLKGIDHHMEKKHPELQMPYNCPFPGCDNVYGTRVGRRTHIFSAHVEEGFSCGHCSKKFSSLSYATAHLRATHRKAQHRRLERGLCAYKTTIDPHNPKMKILTVHPEYFYEKPKKLPPKKASPGIKHFFPRPSDLKDPEKVYQFSTTWCTACKGALPSANQLRSHMHTQHPKLHEFRCIFPNCKQAFTALDLRRRHTETHHMPPSYFCGYCDYSGRAKGQLREHVMMHHQDNPDVRTGSTQRGMLHCIKQEGFRRWYTAKGAILLGDPWLPQKPS